MALSIFNPPISSEATNALLAGLGARAYSQKVYSLGLQQIVNGPSPGDDLFVGWRYLLEINADLGVAGQVSQQSGPPSYAGLSYGPKTAKAVRATREVETLAGLPDGAYELRVLRIPGLLVDSFWLRSNPAGSDKVVPYDAIIEEVQEMYIYEMKDFLERVRLLAQKNMALQLEVEKQPAN
jgi:hypothetical protein